MLKQQRRIISTLAFLVVLIPLLIWVTGCNDNGPAGVAPSNPVGVSPLPPIVNNPVSTPAPDVTVGREACGLDLKVSSFRAKMDAENNITAFVAANYNGDGDLIIYLWDPEVNVGKQYGPFPADKEFTFHVTERRDYDFRVAGEVDTDGDGKADDNCQDDRYRLKVSPPRIPDDPKCDVDLECKEVRETLDVVVNGNNFHRSLVCNVPVNWEHNADEAETDEDSFYGWWQLGQNPRVGTAKATSQQNALCMESFEWKIPADPCFGAFLSATVEQEDGDVHLNINSSSPYTVNWGDGVSNNSSTHEYKRTEQDQVFNIVITNDCLRIPKQIRIPKLTCEELNPPSYSGLTSSPDGGWSLASAKLSYTAHNAGFWSAAIYAGTPNNPKQFRKALDSKDLLCGEDYEFDLEYRTFGHNSCFWTVQALGPGLQFDTIVINRCRD